MVQVEELQAQLGTAQASAAALGEQHASLEQQLAEARQALTEKEGQLASAQEKAQASDADWEGRMKEAVSSAEQWKEFAEKLGADKDAAEAALASAQASLQVWEFTYSRQCLRHEWESVAAREKVPWHSEAWLCHTPCWQSLLVSLLISAWQERGNVHPASLQSLGSPSKDV